MMKLFGLAGVCCALCCLPRLAGADDPPGLEVGANAPDFTLKDQHNDEVTLSVLLEESNVAVVFYRSADW